MTPILEDTLEPPTMAANGRTGLETAPSCAIRGRHGANSQCSDETLHLSTFPLSTDMAARCIGCRALGGLRQQHATMP